MNEASLIKKFTLVRRFNKVKKCEQGGGVKKSDINNGGCSFIRYLRVASLNS